jgi:hypothetical protein
MCSQDQMQAVHHVVTPGAHGTALLGRIGAELRFNGRISCFVAVIRPTTPYHHTQAQVRACSYTRMHSTDASRTSSAACALRPPPLYILCQQKTWKLTNTFRPAENTKCHPSTWPPHTTDLISAPHGIWWGLLVERCRTKVPFAAAATSWHAATTLRRAPNQSPFEPCRAPPPPPPPHAQVPVWPLPLRLNCTARRNGPSELLASTVSVQLTGAGAASPVSVQAAARYQLLAECGKRG